MRLIPVIDIRQGMAVHAQGGDRGRYQPVQSCLTSSADPRILLERLHTAFRCEEVYVADLDALEQTGDNLSLVAELVHQDGGIRLLVDAGVRSAAEARRLLDIGVSRVVLASETSTGPDQIAEIGRAVGFDRVVCSLDLGQGSVLWAPPASGVWTAEEAFAAVSAHGIRSVIILALDRIGKETGVDGHGVAPLIRKFQGMEILIGGGVRDIRDLKTLHEIGVAGALVATAIHRGTLSRDDWALCAGKAEGCPAQPGPG